LYEQRNLAGAATQVAGICGTYERLVSQEPTVARRRVGLRDCLLLRAKLALASGAESEATTFAERAVQIAKSVNTTDPADARMGLAEALRVSGDIRRRSGDLVGARAAWVQAIGAVPVNITEKPPEMREHVLILQRVGRRAEAERLIGRLISIGYRRPVSGTA